MELAFEKCTTSVASLMSEDPGSPCCSGRTEQEQEEPISILKSGRQSEARASETTQAPDHP